MPLAPGTCLGQPLRTGQDALWGSWRSPADCLWSPAYHTGAGEGREHGAETPPAAPGWLPPVVAIPTAGAAARGRAPWPTAWTQGPPLPHTRPTRRPPRQAVSQASAGR